MVNLLECEWVGGCGIARLRLRRSKSRTNMDFFCKDRWVPAAIALDLAWDVNRDVVQLFVRCVEPLRSLHPLKEVAKPSTAVSIRVSRLNEMAIWQIFAVWLVVRRWWRRRSCKAGSLRCKESITIVLPLARGGAARFPKDSFFSNRPGDRTILSLTWAIQFQNRYHRR